MPSGASYDVQILLPIHNEAESIEATIEELYRDLSPQVNLQFLLCEDGSRDNTKEILRGVATRRPAELLLSEVAKAIRVPFATECRRTTPHICSALIPTANAIPTISRNSGRQRAL